MILQCSDSFSLPRKFPEGSAPRRNEVRLLFSFPAEASVSVRRLLLILRQLSKALFLVWFPLISDGSVLISFFMPAQILQRFIYYNTVKPRLHCSRVSESPAFLQRLAYGILNHIQSAVPVLHITIGQLDKTFPGFPGYKPPSGHKYPALILILLLLVLRSKCEFPWRTGDFPPVCGVFILSGITLSVWKSQAVIGRFSE